MSGRKKGIRVSAFLDKLKDPELKRPLMFERDPTVRMLLAEHVLKSRKQARQSVAFRRGRAKGSTNKRTDDVRAHILDLMKRHPKLSPTQLYRKANRQIIGEMAGTTFCNHVRAVRAKIISHSDARVGIAV